MAEALEDLLRQCTVRVKAGNRSGAGFFVAPGKVLTCAHVIGDDDKLSVVWERDGQDPVDIRVAGRMLLNDRGRAIEALAGDYPDIAILDLDDADLTRVGDHPCVALGTKWPRPADVFQAFGYPEQGGSVRLTPVKLAYRGQQGTDPTAYLDLASDKVEPGMSGGPVLDLSSGEVCGVIVASKDVAAPEGALAVTWSCVEADLKNIIDDNREFQAHDRRWSEAARIKGYRTPWPPDRCPFPGLAAMEVRDADVFFGRDDEVRDLVRRANASLGKCDGDLLVMVGPSGAGKSSLLRAGLLAQLSGPGTGWAVADPFEPGVRPLEQLVTRLVALAPQKVTEADCKDRLARDGLAVLAEWLLDHTEPRSKRLLISVDQAEQLTTVTQGKERDELLSVLAGGLGVGSRVTVVMSVRTDHLDELQRLPVIGDVINNLFAVRPIKASRLPAVIECPAEHVGLTFETGLVARLVEDAGRGGSGETVDALPLLAFTLREMYDLAASDRRCTITEADYEQVGRIEGAIEKRAEAAESLLPPGSGPVLASLLPRFVVLSEDRAPTGRPVARDRLSPTETVIVGTLEDQRLLAGTDDENVKGTGRSVRLAHDKLITAWPALAKAVEDQREDLLLETRLERQAKDWDQENGGLLDQAATARASDWLDWRAQAEADKGAVGRYVRASRQALRKRRRRRVTVFSVEVVSVLLVLAFGVVASIFAVVASQQRSQAQSEELAAQAKSLFSTDAPLGMLASIAAYNRYPTPAARSAVLQSTLLPLDSTLPLNSSISSIAFSPDGNTLVVSIPGGKELLWHVADHKMTTTTLLEGNNITSVAFSPNSNTLAVGDIGGDVGLWDVPNGKRTAKLDEGRWVVNSVAFSPDGKILAVGDAGGDVGLWDVADGKRTATLNQGDTVSSVAFTPHGKTLVAAAGDGEIGLWDLDHRQRTATLDQCCSTESIAITPDGQTLAVGDAGGKIGLWNLADDQLTTTLTQGWVNSLAFSPDGTMLAVGDNTGSVGLYYATLPAMPAKDRWTWHLTTLHEGNSVSALAFSRNSKTLAVASADGNVGFWDMANDKSAATLDDGSWVNSVAFSPDGRTLAVATANSQIGLWQVADRQRTATLGAGGPALSVAFSPDGKTLAVGDGSSHVALWGMTEHKWRKPWYVSGGVQAIAYSPDDKTLAVANTDGHIGTVYLWDTTNGKLTATLPGSLAMYSLAFSPDGRTLAVGGYTGQVTLWSVADHKRTATLGDQGDTVRSIAFSPDGKVLAVGEYNGNVTLWDVATHSKSATLTEDSEVLTAAFSPDGQTLAVGDVNGNLDLWDVANGQRIATLNEGYQVTSLAFSLHGGSLAVGDADGEVSVLPASLWTNFDSLKRLLCDEVQSNMTVAQWDASAPDQPYQKTCPGYSVGY